MHFNDMFLFSLTAVHIGAVILILSYSRQLLSQLREPRAPVEECCAKLNVLAIIKVVIHALSAFLLILHGYRLLFAFDLFMLYWRAYDIITSGKKGVYNAEDIISTEELRKHNMYLEIALAYFAVCLCIHISRVFLDWDSFVYIYTLSTTHGMIVFLAHYLLTFTDIEYDSRRKVSRARKLCKKLNKYLPIKLLLHAALTSVLFAYGYWILFIINLPVLIAEVLEITRTREGDSGVYEAAHLEVTVDHRIRCYKYLGFFLIFLHVTTYCMVGKSSKPFILPLILMYQVLTTAAGLPLICPIVSIALLAICKKWPNKINPVTCCNWLNALYFMNTLLYIHICTFLLVQGHLFLLFFNLSLLYHQITEMIKVQEGIFGIYAVDEIRSRDQIGHLIQMYVHYLVYFLGLCSANMYCLYLVYTKDLLFRVSLVLNNEEFFNMFRFSNLN